MDGQGKEADPVRDMRDNARALVGALEAGALDVARIDWHRVGRHLHAVCRGMARLGMATARKAMID